MNGAAFLFSGWEPILRILVVGTGAYAALVLLLRVSRKRTLARLNAFDFVITVAVGASFGRVLTARQVALAEAVAAFALLVMLQWAVSSLQLRSPRFARAITAPPTLLYFRGRFLPDALQRERLREDEVREAVREHGIGSLDAVEAIVFEADGGFAVIPTRQADDLSILAPLTEGVRDGEPG